MPSLESDLALIEAARSRPEIRSSKFIDFLDSRREAVRRQLGFQGLAGEGLVPGFIQTERYASRVMEEAERSVDQILPPEALGFYVALRMSLGRVARAGSFLQLGVTEKALRPDRELHPFLTPDVMREQIDHIIGLVDSDSPLTLRLTADPGRHYHADVDSKTGKVAHLYTASYKFERSDAGYRDPEDTEVSVEEFTSKWQKMMRTALSPEQTLTKLKQAAVELG